MAAPLDVSVSRVLRAERARVARLAADPANAPLWYENIRSVVWKSAPSVEPGAKAAFAARFLGRELAYTYEIVEHQPGERLVMRTAEGPFPMETIYEWADAGRRRTRMRLTNRGAPQGFRAVLAPFMALAMRRAMSRDLAALDRLLRKGGAG